MSTQPAALQAWHRIVDAGDPSMLDTLLDDDVVFYSPAVFTPQQGKAITTAYLSAAVQVLGPNLRYLHQWFDETSAVLEFETRLDTTVVHGIDMLRWNRDNRLTSFTVMVRPLRGLQQVMAEMGQRLNPQSA